MNERILNPCEKAYLNMTAVTAMLNALKPMDKNISYVVGDTYLDFGQDWKWTTILRKGGEWGDVQILYPAEWQEIVLAETAQDFADIVNEIRSGEYFRE